MPIHTSSCLCMVQLVVWQARLHWLRLRWYRQLPCCELHGRRHDMVARERHACLQPWQTSGPEQMLLEEWRSRLHHASGSHVGRMPAQSVCCRGWYTGVREHSSRGLGKKRRRMLCDWGYLLQGGVRPKRDILLRWALHWPARSFRHIRKVLMEPHAFAVRAIVGVTLCCVLNRSMIEEVTLLLR